MAFYSDAGGASVLSGRSLAPAQSTRRLGSQRARAGGALFPRAAPARENATAAAPLSQDAIGDLGHELQTPLASITACLGLLAAHVDNSDARNLLEVALRNSQRMTRLIDDVLDVERMKMGRLSFDSQTHRLGLLLEGACTLIAPYARSRGVDVKVDVGSVDGYVFVDLDRFTQVLTNLISNAVKFSACGQAVRARIEFDGDFLVVAIEDFGPGIEENVQSRLFQRYARGERSQGTGLGLSIAKEIMLGLGGKISFVTELGVGTTFRVWLPELRECDPSLQLHMLRLQGGQEHKRERSHRRPQAPSRRILCVEDDDDIRDVIALSLMREGDFAVRTCSRGRKALAIAQSWKPHMIVLDAQMPGLDGLATLRRLRARSGLGAPKVVCLTARAEAGAVAEWMAAGAAGVLRKPFDARTLPGQIREMLLR